MRVRGGSEASNRVTGRRFPRLVDLQAETTRLLQDIIRFDTVNPPGNERPAQEHLARVLSDAGFEVELLGRTEERPNLVARLRGSGDGPSLCLLSHVDTVLATPDDWKHGPWSGDVADGFLWGRGALDMKSQTAAEVVAAIDIAQRGESLAGDLLVVVCADEEAGGTEGVQWLCETPPRHGPLRLRAQRGRRRGDPVRRRPRLRRVRRREGRVPLYAAHGGRRRPRVDPEDRRQRATEGGAAARRDARRATPHSTSPRGRGRCSRGWADRRRGAAWRRCARATRCWPCSSSR